MSSVRIRLPLPGPLVKRLRHRPFTAVTWVRFPYGSPKKERHPSGCLSFFIVSRESNHLNATVRWTVAGDGWTEPNLYFCLWQKCKSSPFSPTKRRQAIGVHHKGQFSKIRCILKKICRILHLCPQMQCLSVKLTSHR